MLRSWRSAAGQGHDRGRQRFLDRVFHRIYRKNGFSPLPVIAMGFAGLILLGSLLLSLPVASASGRSVGWFDALFTSTSAVCVTGLVVLDTGTAYSAFGHVVLLVLIQLGGLGFMTFATLIFRLMGRQITLREKLIMQDSMNEDVLGGIVQLVQWVAISSFTVELTGTALFTIRLIPMYGPGKGLFYALFHAVSAFCNAGFDLFGYGRSLTGFSGDVLINLTAIMLVVVGGLGFGVQSDILRRRRFDKFRLHTKLVLASYGTLMAVSFVMVLALEWSNPSTLGAMPIGQKLLAALFQAVTLRTAGFNTFDQAAMRDCTKLIGSFMMVIGAAPASTGGGIKVTTLAILFLTARMVARGESSIRVFGRRIDPTLITRAMTVTFIALAVVFIDVCVLSLMQPGAGFLDLLYECASAMGTVGISAIGSSSLRPLARIMIILTMFTGRVGPLTLALLFARRQNRTRELIQYPEEHIMIG
ncbi:MAG: Trk family potassium uptake protein [Clostridia bacterium]|nr:Trk family potassium uptake protein [Clostridia bacterium]